MSNKSPVGAQAAAGSCLPLRAVDNSHGGGIAAAKGKVPHDIKFALHVQPGAGCSSCSSLTVDTSMSIRLSLLLVCTDEDKCRSKGGGGERKERGDI